MSDLRDPGYAEQLEAEEPEAYLRRREFLQRTAVTAGLAAGLGTVLHPDLLVAEAARRQRRVALPNPRNAPIDTFVVLMMENRSFDHYLGWLPRADGRQAGLSYVDEAGKRESTRRFAPDFQGCAYKDPDHSWDGTREEIAGGKMDGWLRADNDIYALSYYTEKDIPFIPAAAKAFTTYDRFFCSVAGPTFPNREYMHAGESYGQKRNTLPPDAGYPSGFPDNTIFAALAQKGISGRYFFNDLPAAGLWGAPGFARSSRVEEYYARCENGTLPALSFVDPVFMDDPRGSGTRGDEHPHGDIRVGQAFMADVVHAFMESPHWKRGALFITYDEHGGFFDHVRPPRVPDQRNSRNLADDFGQLGVRIPVVAISPWVRRGYVDHSVHGFESILKMICWRFGIRPLNRRVRYARNIARSFDFSQARQEPPSLPDPPNIMGQPCPSNEGGARAAGQAPPHDLSLMLTSGYLDRMGFEFRPATPETMFRQPSKVESARRKSS